MRPHSPSGNHVPEPPPTGDPGHGLPTGAQHVLELGEQRAVVTEVGATLRSYEVGGRPVVWTFDEDDLPEACQGQQLMPWPNRIRDGRWSLDGVVHQLAVNEPGRGNAIHGLVASRPFVTVERGPALLVQALELTPEPGWPGHLELVVQHQLDPHGLVVEVSARNRGSSPIPFGYACHPYLLPPAGIDIDQALLSVPFGSFLETDDRLLPVALHPVAGTQLDLREPRQLEAQALDTAFTGALTGPDGCWQVLLDAQGARTALWGDASMGWLQVYTPDSRDRIAVEPMTIGPDAFNPGPTHDGLQLIDPGATSTCRWGLQHFPALAAGAAR